METEKEQGLENLLSNENEMAKKKKIRLIIAGVSALLVLVVVIIIIVSINKKDKKNSDEPSDEPSDKTSDEPSDEPSDETSDEPSDIPTEDPSYKFTSIETVPLPEGIIYDSHAIYSKTGRILLIYKYENDTNSNKTYIGVMDEDGSNLNELWSGEWKALYNSNGIRLMPFNDNKKILTGDYILECFPDIDNCANSTLYGVIYPKEAVEMDGVYFVWSEIIVSPDEHIAWSTLSFV